MSLLQGGEGKETGQCKRCREKEAFVIVRSEKLCRDCFARYVDVKMRKRVDIYRVRGLNRESVPKLLLALSLGVSSTALLHLLDGLWKFQLQRSGNLTGFSLCCLIVDEDLTGSNVQHVEAKAQQLRELYPEHDFHTASLEDVVKYPEIWNQLPSSIEGHAVEQGLNSLQQYLQGLPSASSRVDISTILRTRLITEVAKQNECEGILFGDTTTRLAEKTLAQTAKGRGFSLPWQFADGPSPNGLTTTYPLRDVLRKEVIAYATLLSQTLREVIVDPQSVPRDPAAAKANNIDNLMTRYFASVEDNYPSIVANVVKTSGKLNTPDELESGMCQVCSLPLPTEGGSEKEEEQGLCYGCTRSILDRSKTSHRREMDI